MKPEILKNNAEFKLSDYISEKNGALDIYTMTGEFVPMAEHRIMFKSGSFNDIKPGMAYLTANMLKRGTNKLSFNDISEKIENLGGSLSITVNYDFITLKASSLSRYSPEILEVFYDVISEPAFQQAELDKVKKNTISNISHIRSNPARQLRRVFNSIMFEATAYGHSIYGNEDSISSISVDDIRQFYEDNFLYTDKFLIRSGRLNGKGSIPANILKGLESKGYEKPGFIKRNNDLYFLNNKNQTQAEILLGKIVPGRENSDYTAMQIANTALGGYFLSELNTSLREERGLTYGIHSYIEHRKNVSVLMISASVNLENLPLVFSEIFRVLEKYGSGNIEDHKLETAANYMTGSFIRNIDTIFDHANLLANLKLFDLEDDYYDNFIRESIKLDTGKIKQAAKKYLNTGGWLIGVGAGSIPDGMPEIINSIQETEEV